MSVLKKKVTLALSNKIALRRIARRREQYNQIQQQPIGRENVLDDHHDNNLDHQQQQREPIPTQAIKTREYNSRFSRRTIIRNYSRAMLNFAKSTFALSSLDGVFSGHRINIDNFREFIRSRDVNIDKTDNLRNLLFVQRTDTQEVIKMKRAFKELCVVFLRTFSMNWIMQSKVTNKIAHINYRFKMLRRVMDPRLFAHL